MENNSFSFLKGYSFQFDIDGNEVVAWFSAFSGREKIFVNGKLIASQRNYSTNSTNKFVLNGKEYLTTLKVASLLRGPCVCTLSKEGVAIKRKKLVFPRISFKKGTYDLIVVLTTIIGIGVLLVLLGKYFAVSSTYLYVVFFIVLFGFIVLGAKINKKLGRGPIIEDEEIE